MIHAFSRHVAGLAVVASVCLAANASHAALVLYSFGSPGQETAVETSPVFNPTSVDANASATAITDPAGTVGIEVSSAATTPAGAPYLRLDPQGGSTSAAQAVTANKYFQFILTPNAGFEMDLTTLTFKAARGGGGTPRGYVVRSSADGFAADLAAADLLTARPTYTDVSISLGAAAFQNLTSALTFRIYSYSTGAGASVDYDDIAVNGVISAVPEPSTLALCAVGLAILLLRRNRRER